MVAEAYQAESDPELAARRLALLGSDPPAEITLEALEYARLQSFMSQEISQLEELLSTMQIYGSAREGTQP
jgi:hypothetical protein